MTTVRDIEQYLYAWAPRELAESWDNVGLLVGDPEVGGGTAFCRAGRNAAGGGRGHRKRHALTRHTIR